LLFFRDQTTDSDETGQNVPKVDVPTGRPELGARAVEVLNRHVGEHGDGPKGTPGYHHGEFIGQVQRGAHGDIKGTTGQPWCALAVRWAYETAAAELGQPRPFSGVKGTLAMAKSWKDAPFDVYKLESPKVGAALILGDSHATLIAKVHDGNTVTTVEGNHGDAVANVKRTIKPTDTIVDVAGYVAAAQTLPRQQGPRIAGLDLMGAIAC
jgi:hypothetical protein